MLGEMLAAPLCQGAVRTTFDQSVRAKLESVVALLGRAVSMEGAQQGRVLKKVRFRLQRVKRQTLRATANRRSARRLSTACAATIERFIADEERRLTNR